MKSVNPTNDSIILHRCTTIPTLYNALFLSFQEWMRGFHVLLRKNPFQIMLFEGCLVTIVSPISWTICLDFPDNMLFPLNHQSTCNHTLYQNPNTNQLNKTCACLWWGRICFGKNVNKKNNRYLNSKNPHSIHEISLNYINSEWGVHAKSLLQK